MKKLLLLLLSMNLSFHYVMGQEWKPLFNGHNLDGWKQHGGPGLFEVVDGMIRGTTVPSPMNSFLCTVEKYGDFILETDVMLTHHMNSGIQFRSDIRISDDRVYGYQCEIEPTMRRFSGGIYDEARRLWLYPLSRNTKAYDAFRVGTWNKVRIECLGNEIRTYINGVMCARMVDDMSPDGIIALQVHGINRPEDVGQRVYWRNLNILTSEVDKYRLPPDPAVEELSFLNHSITPWEAARGWKMVDFIGASPNENKEYPLTTGQSITSIHTYGDFDLSFEFKLSQGTEGLLVYASHENFVLAYQLNEDQSMTAEARGVYLQNTTAALAGLIAGDNITTPGRPKQFKGKDIWNQGRITRRNGIVEHWISSELALRYSLEDQALDALTKAVWNIGLKDLKASKLQPIAFQVANGELNIKNVKIRQF